MTNEIGNIFDEAVKVMDDPPPSHSELKNAMVSFFFREIMKVCGADLDHIASQHPGEGI